MTALSKTMCILKRGDTRADRLRKEISSHLAKRGCKVDSASSDMPVDLSGYDLVLSLGGDGTFISAARKAVEHGVPVLGINLGKVGFLVGVDPDCWMEVLDTLISDELPTLRTLALQYEIIRNGESVHKGLASNDLVVSRGELARLVRLKVSFEGGRTGLRADGLIVTTPNGSSAYGVSAGGPLIHPGVPAYGIIPICPFLGSFRPTVLPKETVTEIVVEDSNGPVNVTEDGQRLFHLADGDVLRVSRSDKDLIMVDVGGCYLERLSRKGFMTEG
jgi:NAD+ kinase